MFVSCLFCNVEVESDQLSAHSETERHKLLCKQNVGEDYYTYVVRSAFKCRIITYRINGSSSSLLIPELYLKSVAEKVKKILFMECENYKHIKVNMKLFCSYVIIKGENEVSRDLKYFNTKNVPLQLSSDLSTYYDETCSIIMTKCGEFQEKDSGWTLEKIEYLELAINKYVPLKGESYIPLPDWIKRKHACVNVKNEDNACFFWAVASALYPVASHSDRVSSYPHYETVFKTTGIDLPVSTRGIKCFEVMNQINVNVYGIENNKFKKITPLYISQMKPCDRQVNLLYYEDVKHCYKNHYCWIKNMSRLIGSQITKHEHKLFFCYGCLQNFPSECKLQHHKNLGCQNTLVELPSVDNKYLSFNNYSHQLSVPFVIYADFESILKPLKMDAMKSTYYSHEHIPCSFAYYIHCNYNGALSKFVTYRGEDCVAKFVENIYSDASQIADIYSRKIPYDKTEIQGNASHCHICEQPLLASDQKVIDHCHLTGKIRGVAHQQCNLKYSLPNYIPIFFHNLSEYDSHLFIKELAAKGRERIECIPLNKEKYISFSQKLCFKHKDDGSPTADITIRFVDSFKFMSTSLEKLVENLSPVQFQILSRHFADPQQMSLLTRKGVFPYEYVDCWAKLEDSSLPDKHSFYSELTRSHISDSDYAHAQTVWNKFDIKTLGEYCDLYLKTDVVLLAEVYENFRDICLSSYKLDPCRYLTAPGLSWDAMLRQTRVNLELLTDYEMIQFIQSGIRGGISQVSKRHAKANNSFSNPATYNPMHDNNFIVYLDVNNLYGHAMSQYLPYANFVWLTGRDIDSFEIRSQRPDSDVGYILEVDLEYPQSLHDLHNDYPFCAETKTPPNGKDKKLLLTLNNKQNYIIHYVYLKQCLEHGLVCKKIHRILSFRQSAWLKPYIDLNTEKRTLAKTSFEKDFYKLMNNSIFGKTIENVAKRVDVKLCNTWSDKKSKTKCRYGAERYIARPNFHSCKIFSEDFVAVQMNKSKIVYNKPIYVGFTVLEISKHVMYNFHYSYMLPKYKHNVQLLYTDTDSFIYEIKTANFYEDIRCDLDAMFDTSDFPENNIYNLPLVNKKVVGLMKDECNGRIIEEFIGLRSKMYSYLLQGDLSVKKNKGTTAAIVRKLHFENYRKALDFNYVEYDNMHTLTSDSHNVYTQIKRKKVLSSDDDKRFITEDNVNTLAWGHYKIK